MFDSYPYDPQQKSTGTGYTFTVALLSVAFVFSPALLVISRPFGHAALALSIMCSVACVTLAWFTWKKSSQLSIPSIVFQEAKRKR